MKASRIAALAAITLVSFASATMAQSFQRNPVSIGNDVGGFIPRGGPVTITHSLDQTVSSGSGVACADQDTGATTDNSIWRSFDLAAFGILNQFDVQGVDFGVSSVVELTTGVFPYTINLYVDTNGGAPLLADLSLIGTASGSLASGSAPLLVSQPVLGSVPGGATLVVEWAYPDAQGLNPGDLFGAMYFGGNSTGQTGPTYISSAVGCGIADPTDLALFGFGDQHWVLNVTGNEIPEPTTLGLLGLGVMALIRRRK